MCYVYEEANKYKINNVLFSHLLKIQYIDQDRRWTWGIIHYTL